MVDSSLWSTYQDAIHTNVTTNYNLNIAPSQTVDVSLELGLLHINNVDTKEERLQMAAFLIVYWTDDRLAWDPVDFGNYSDTKIRLSLIWSPPLVIANSADDIAFMNDGDGLASMYAYLTSTGHIAWMMPANVDSQCSMDITYYPFDHQQCSVIISSWMFTKNEINITADQTLGINMAVYDENGEWDIVSRTVGGYTRILHGFPMPAGVFTIGMQRKYSYYLLNMMLPVVLLTAIGPLVFALPVESGEKNGFALTILLSLSVLITVVSDNIPPSSTTICILSVYLITVYIMSAVEILVVVIVCRLHNKTSKGETPAPRIQSVCRKLERILCYKKCEKNDDIKNTTKVAPVNSEKQLELGEIESEKEEDQVYTYEQFADYIDVASLYLFCALTFLINLIFSIALTTGGLTLSFLATISAQDSYVWKSILKSNITTDYVTDIAPNTTTTISIQLGLMSILSLDTRSEIFLVSGFLLMSWTDGRLTWTPSDFNGLEMMKMKVGNVWTPPIMVANGGSSIKLINDDSDLSSVYLNVQSDGTVTWLSPANIDAQCTMNIKTYPFDTQECTVIISSWIFTAQEINFLAYPSFGINLDLYETNGEWDLVSQEVQTNERSLLGNIMPTVHFTVGLQRKYSYYLLNMMLPVVLLTAIGPLVFALPVESGEKNGFALTILLSLSVLITVVSDNIPPSSTNVSILSVYLLVTFILSTVECYFVVLVCRLHNKTSQGETPGQTVQSACRFLEKILCVKSCKNKTDDERVNSSKITPMTSKDASKLEEAEVDDDDVKEYSYEDFANLVDRMCCYSFFILTALLTFIFMILLMTGA
ncbi:hypothetical protein ACF0H5_018511 [Mactra antiquata]